MTTITEPIEESKFKAAISEVITQNLSSDSFTWLQQKAALIREEKGTAQLNMAFAAMPRKTGRQTVELTPEQREIITAIHRGFSIDDWPLDRLARLWLLLQVDDSDKKLYCTKIADLFKGAEMNELAALYSSLYFFSYPKQWEKQCAEGIRSNIGLVLEAIMYHNPYPYKNLDDLAWNQLVMKAFFTEKDVSRIIGLDERANKELALILIDYANERWAARRSVNPQLWRLVTKFIDHGNFKNIEKAFRSADAKEKQGAALASFYSDFAPAKELVDSDPELRLSIEEKRLNWFTL